MAYVPNSPITALYNNTSPGTPADPNAMDNAIGAIVGTINENYDFVTSLLNTTNLSNMNIFNAKNYGAKGDGVADDTSAIRNAHDACYAAGGGIVFIPAGTFNISGTITKKEKVSFVGAGANITTLVWTTVAGGTMIDTTNYRLTGTSIENMTLTKADSVTGDVTGILGGSTLANYNSTGLTVRFVRFYKLKYGCRGNGASDVGIYDSIFDRVTAEQCFYGLHIHGSQNMIIYPRILACDYGLVLDWLSTTSIAGVQAYSGIFINNGIDIYVPTAHGLSTRNCLFSGCWFEGATENLVKIEEANSNLLSWMFVECLLSCKSTDPLLDFANATGFITLVGCILYKLSISDSIEVVKPTSSSGKLVRINTTTIDVGAMSLSDLSVQLKSGSRNEEQSGTTATTELTTLATVTIDVTFPVAFSQVPYVFVQSGSVRRILCTVGNVTTSGFQIFAYNFDATTSTQIKWLAKG